MAHHVSNKVFHRLSKQFFWLVIGLLLLLSGGQIFIKVIEPGPGDLIISEFVAVNQTGLVDEDGDVSDWIEIYNRSNQAVNLSGWSLTDDPADPIKWMFPDLTLGSHKYLIIFASGKNRKVVGPETPLHTNFKIGQRAEFLGLHNIFQHRYVDQISPDNPEQFSNVSYGVYGETLRPGYFPNPTPGQANSELFIPETEMASSPYAPLIASAPADQNYTDVPAGDELNTATAAARLDLGLRITEIMYNPVGGGDYEFIELENVGETRLDLANAFFEGIKYTFPQNTFPLAPSDFVVLVRNLEAFSERYPGVAVDGVYRGQFSNKGETITVKDAAGRVMTSVTYDDENAWPISPDGLGDSLVLDNLAGDPNNPLNWRASIELYGSPGTGSTLAAIQRDY
jgi:hypothetical protein